ncbi:hypothetical protein NEHOM01_1307 [Nematocida homosporus]|uniref:uncharacterized protein n=1 Tax=Nematocida homosporus TaxID=1912981 RepID=UPI00222033DE|nr:uncharacterized protein NEHOM01_1307 [Nematocida homosporus]KAI5186142.1 hypothetical protein NEHOM01_1307 [Nematocida homosporus]
MSSDSLWNSADEDEMQIITRESTIHTRQIEQSQIREARDKIISSTKTVVKQLFQDQQDLLVFFLGYIRAQLLSPNSNPPPNQPKLTEESILNHLYLGITRRLKQEDLTPTQIKTQITNLITQIINLPSIHTEQMVHLLDQLSYQKQR